MKVWTSMIQRNSMIIGSMDFDNPKDYSDTSFFDGLVFLRTWLSELKVAIE